MSLSSIPRSLRVSVRERDGGRCRYCGMAQVGQVATFHVDHVVPRRRGGHTDLSNLVLQCPWCSLHKSDKIGAADPATGVTVRLFHPLQDPWSDHFELRDDATLGGRTEVGRATIAALRMNEPLPRSARALQKPGRP